MRHQHDYYGFVYLWRDSETNRFYIGSHYGSTTDSYIASSKWLKSAYKKRPHTFRRRILQYLTTDDKKLLHQIEQAWLDLIKDEELGKRYYNLKKFAAGGNGSANKGKTRISWRKGLSNEMIQLRKDGLFCVMSCDKPKPRNQRVTKPKKVTIPRKPTPIIDKDCELCGTTFQTKRAGRFCSKSCSNKNNGKNVDRAANGRKGSEKMREIATNRIRHYDSDGSWTWMYKEKSDPSC